MAISYQQAVEALSTGDWTVEAIFELVRQVSASVPGATKDTIYLLNSGLMPDGFGSSDVARALVESGRAVSVGQTDVARLLSRSSEFVRALHRSIKLELFGDPNYQPFPTSQAEFDAIEEKFFLYRDGKLGASPFGSRIPNANSLWDIGSRNYVIEAHGKFRTKAYRVGPLQQIVPSRLSG